MIEIRYIVRIRRFRRPDPLSAKIRELRDLVREHLLHALLRQDPIRRRGGSPTVEQGGEDLRVVRGPAEAARAGGVVYAGDFGRGGDQGSAVEVVSGPYVAGGLLVHVCQVGFHLRGGEHGYVVEVERGEDVGLEVFVQGHGCCALDECACPVYADLTGGGGGGGVSWMR